MKRGETTPDAIGGNGGVLLQLLVVMGFSNGLLESLANLNQVSRLSLETL